MQIEPTLPILMNPQVSLEPKNVDVRNQELSQAATAAVQVQEVDQVISNLAHAVQPFDIALKFSKDTETGAIVIEMINQLTGETLQQIPNEAMLHVAAVLGKLQGQIFNRKA